MSRSFAIVGAGFSGAVVARELAEGGHRVTIFERMPSPARKLLLAGLPSVAHAEALALCRRNESSTAPCPRMFFLMGMLHQAVGDLDRAESCLHKTLYLDADHDEALLALAVVATRRGDDRRAETYRRSAARVLERKGSS